MEMSDHTEKLSTDEDHSVPRSVISVLITVILPLAFVKLFAIFWLAATLRHQMDSLFFLKRIVLITIAVCYISYISITKTLVNILNCIEVHDCTDVMIDATSDYRAMDTSLKCYEGSHAALAGSIGWPLLLLFTLGFPAVMA